MVTFGGTRPGPLDTAIHCEPHERARAVIKLDRLARILADGVAILVGLALVVPSLLVLFSPLIAAMMD